MLIKGQKVTDAEYYESLEAIRTQQVHTFTAGEDITSGRVVYTQMGKVYVKQPRVIKPVAGERVE